MRFKNKFFILIWTVLFSIPVCTMLVKAQENQWFEGAMALTEGPSRIIFDTDMGPDFDDAGALAVLHALSDHGKAEILATVSSNKLKEAAPVIDVINTYFGHPDIPIGAPKSDEAIKMGNENHWNQKVARKYPHDMKTTDEAPDATELYRRVLANQPDSSVIIVTVGFLTNMADLLKSQRDRYSPLKGRQLVAKKVKKWVCMGGDFPEGNEFNLRTDAEASKYALNHWPTPILFSGFKIGKDIMTGNRLVKKGPRESPVRFIYEYCLKTFNGETHSKGRMSWDQTAVLAAGNGIKNYWNIARGKIIIHDDGSNAWESNPKNDNHAYLKVKKSPARMEKIIENLMMHEPSNR